MNQGHIRIGVDGRELFAGAEGGVAGGKTGICRYLENLLIAINRHLPLVSIYLYFPSSTVVSSKEIPFRVIPRPLPGRGGLFWENVLLPFALSQDRVDVFFSPYYKRPLFPLSCPAVTTIHDLHFLKNRGWKAFYHRISHFFSIQGAYSIAVSFATSERMKLHYKLLQAPYVLRTCLPEKFFPAEHIADDGPILYIGNHLPHKNLPMLAQAYQGLPKDLKDKHPLHLSGLENKILREICPEIHFLGILSDEELPDMYRKASLLVLPSLREGFGLPVLEAMGCGLPVLSSNLPAIKEITGGDISCGGAVCLVNSFSFSDWTGMIEKILKNKELMSMMRKKGLEEALKFRSKQTALRAEILFREVLKIKGMG